jgi:hypothetical protein
VLVGIGDVGFAHGVPREQQYRKDDGAWLPPRSVPNPAPLTRPDVGPCILPHFPSRGQAAADVTFRAVTSR